MFNPYTLWAQSQNETTRHGIIAHCLWEENLGNITEVFVKDSFGFVARSLWFCCPNAISERNNFGLYYFLFWDKVWATKPKTSGNETEAIGNDDLGYVSQIFLPKTTGNDTVPCGFVYMIAPFMCLH